jgi:hypothetical protein
MKKISGEYLEAHGYRINSPYKVVAGSAVFAVVPESGDDLLVAKLVASTNDFGRLATEEAALRFLAREGFCSTGVGPRVPELVEVLPERRVDGKLLRGFVMTHAPGRLLSDCSDMPEAWWRRVVGQAVEFIARLEAVRVLHNDFWDQNVVADSRGDITVLDFQYTDHYTEQPAIFSPIVRSRSTLWRAEQLSLGWTARWHVGGDLNQLLGILAAREVLPPDLAEYVSAHAYVRAGEEFPYATIHPNEAMSGARLNALLSGRREPAY